MSTTFATLLRTTHTLRFLSNAQLAVWIQFFLKNCKSRNGANYIIDGVFKTLYEQGDCNDVEFFNELLKKSQELKESTTTEKETTNNATTSNSDDESTQEKDNINSKPEMSRKKVNYFQRVPDDLLCEIGSYLTISELFCRWNHVCHQFFQIGVRSETIQHWNFPKGYEDDWLDIHTCHRHDWQMWTVFEFNLKLFHLQSMKFTRKASQMEMLLDCNIMKMPKTVEIGMSVAIDINLVLCMTITTPIVLVT